MQRPKSSKEACDLCERDGFFNPQESADRFKIESMVNNAVADLEQARKIIPLTQKNSGGWSTIYKLHYDVLRELADACIRFDCVKSANHWCLFAFLCEKHPELEFSWEFLEKVRTKRNGIYYYGTPIAFTDFKEIEFQINLYIETLRKAIEKKLKELD